MSALLLTVVILGVCVAAVVADLLFGSDQPATPLGKHHRDYGGPWRRWQRAAQRRLARVADTTMTGARRVGRATTELVRGTAASSKASGEAMREGLKAVRARRRAFAQRHEAHARHVAHLDISAEAPPRPYPLPPPAEELVEEKPSAPYLYPGMPESTVPLPPPTLDPEIVRPPAPPRGAPTLRPRRDGRPGARRGGRRRTPYRPNDPTRPMQALVPAQTVEAPSNTVVHGPLPPPPPGARPLPLPAPRSLQAPPPVREGGALVPVEVPWSTRIRSGVMLVALMTILGVVTTAAVLGIIFVVVQTLASL